MVHHVVSAHWMCWATKCLKWAIKGQVAERDLEGAARVATLGMNEFGVVISATRLAVLGRHSCLVPMALPGCLRLLGALHVRVPRARAQTNNLL